VKTLALLVVGRGRLGRALGRALAERGARVVAWAGRGAWPRVAPAVDGVLLAVPDPFVAEVARALAPRLPAGVPLLHASGALGPEVLAETGHPHAAMHPLVSFAAPRAPTLEGTTFVVAGDRAAVRVARRIAATVGARAIARGVHGPRYHAAAALVANGAAALATRAVELFVREGFTRRDAERAIGALLRSVGENVIREGVPRALTGPIVRGDAATVARHRAALEGEALHAYDALAPIVLAVAIEAGLAPSQADVVRRALASRRDQPR
jgi:predicted short-subunit dehydrogenase-like oxidoreductase (DUF2520 family)